jgi:hypothetical protein
MAIPSPLRKWIAVPELPKWEALPIQAREAIINFYLAGRLDALIEMKQLPS